MKPSELPENTVISDPENGRFIKETSTVWMEISPAYRELPYYVWDHGHPNKTNRPSNFVPEKSDEYFKDFEIVSLPSGWIHPDLDTTVSYWYDLNRMRVVRKTVIHEIIEDHPDLKEEDIATAKPLPLTWNDVPGFPTYETRMTWNDGILVRNKKTKKYKKRNKSGFFVLYKDRKTIWWCEGELGTSNQINHFYKTGEVGADV